jgi:hypothetical protein
VGPGELHRTRRMRVGRESEDGATQSGGIAGRKASKLALGGRRELDAAASLAHASSGS